MVLDLKQRGVLRNMLAALAVAAIVLGASVLWPPSVFAAPADLALRLALTLKWDALVLLCLIATIGNLARHRFFTPADIDGSGRTSGTGRAHMLQALLQNTLEQSVIAVIAHLVWTAATPTAWHGAVPAAVLIFVAGRVLFVAGYKGGAPARAFGFALTFYPTVLLTLGALACLLRSAASGV
ncbi:MAPEG family protein [Nisaea sediminum]|uniref:MAPEG family protein n=1 Tax=Nisaea sediminum TaxID=2775867 RepID=UPI001D022436|nr:MAPEG family protein [Nisaea sediminum]